MSVGSLSILEKRKRRLGLRTMKRQRDTDQTYLGCLLGSTGLRLREGRRRGLAAGLFGRLSLRKDISESCSPSIFEL